jgi:hypothetical protein
MGVFYHIQPFDDEMASFLEAMGAAVPDSDTASRNPTPAEVRAVCGALPDVKVEFNVKAKSHWQAVIDSTKRDEGTLLNMEKFKGAEDKPLPFFFEKGSPSLILEIVKRLAKQCGPLVVVPDTGDAPIAVTSTASVKKLLKEWEHTAGQG